MVPDPRILCIQECLGYPRMVPDPTVLNMQEGLGYPGMVPNPTIPSIVPGLTCPLRSRITWDFPGCPFPFIPYCPWSKRSFGSQDHLELPRMSLPPYTIRCPWFNRSFRSQDHVGLPRITWDFPGCPFPLYHPLSLV